MIKYYIYTKIRKSSFANRFIKFLSPNQPISRLRCSTSGILRISPEYCIRPRFGWDSIPEAAPGSWRDPQPGSRPRQRMHEHRELQTRSIRKQRLSDKDIDKQTIIQYDKQTKIILIILKRNIQTERRTDRIQNNSLIYKDNIQGKKL